VAIAIVFFLIGLVFGVIITAVWLFKKLVRGARKVKDLFAHS
jgi:uncharacterized membrane protein YciS (DUF1049 family)